jgi:hypothetical protein
MHVARNATRVENWYLVLSEGGLRVTCTCALGSVRWTRSSEWSVAKTGGQTGQHSITLEKTLFIKIVTIEP